jgi:hypothetical protein
MHSIFEIPFLSTFDFSKVLKVEEYIQTFIHGMIFNVVNYYCQVQWKLNLRNE